MSKDDRRLLIHSRFYALAAVLNRGASFALLPLFGYALTPADLGVYALVVMSTELVGLAFGANVLNAIWTVYFIGASPDERDVVASTTILGFGGATCASLVLAYPFARFADYALFDSHLHTGLLLLAYVGMVTGIWLDLGLTYFRMTKKSSTYAGIAAAKNCLFLLLNCLFVLKLGLGVFGIVLANLVATLALSLPVLTLILRTVGTTLSRRHFSRLLTVGAHLIPASAADALFEATDRTLLNWLGGSAMVGQYSLGTRVASILPQCVTSPFAQIWVVHRLEALKRGSVLDYVPFNFFFALITWTTLALALYAPEAMYLAAAADYQATAVVIPLLCAAHVLIALNMDCQVDIFHAARTRVLLAISIICTTVHFALAYALISRLGLLGAGLATLLTSILRTALTAWLGRRYCAAVRSLEWNRIGVILVGASLCFAAGRVFVGAAISWQGSLLKLTLLAGFALVLFWQHLRGGFDALTDIQRCRR